MVTHLPTRSRLSARVVIRVLRQGRRTASSETKLLELRDELLRYTGLPGHLHRIDVKIKELKSLLIRAADALENGRTYMDSQLVQELRKAAE
jgi:hypothetical protein